MMNYDVGFSHMMHLCIYCWLDEQLSVDLTVQADNYKDSFLTATSVYLRLLLLLCRFTSCEPTCQRDFYKTVCQTVNAEPGSYPVCSCSCADEETGCCLGQSASVTERSSLSGSVGRRRRRASRRTSADTWLCFTKWDANSRSWKDEHGSEPQVSSTSTEVRNSPIFSKPLLFFLLKILLEKKNLWIKSWPGRSSHKVS